MLSYHSPPSRPLTVGMVLFPDLTQLDLTGPYEVFSRIPGARVRLIAETDRPVRSEQGLTIVPDAAYGDAAEFDVVLVPGGPGVNQMMENEALLSFLRDRAGSARYLTAVCTGALVLGAAGLLRGYRATTHWLSLDLLPLFGADPVSERVVVDRNRITGGGVTAGIDFGLAVAAAVAGPDVAEEIQLLLEYAPAPPFASGSPRTADPALVQRVRESRRGLLEMRRKAAERAAARLEP